VSPPGDKKGQKKKKKEIESESSMLVAGTITEAQQLLHESKKCFGCWKGLPLQNSPHSTL